MVNLTSFDVELELERARRRQGGRRRQRLHIRLRDAGDSPKKCGKEVIYQTVAAAPPTTKPPCEPELVMCRFCKKEGHSAGFVGSIFIDCPYKPCFLCLKSGHRTAECPHGQQIAKISYPSQPPTGRKYRSRGKGRSPASLVPLLLGRECENGTLRRFSPMSTLLPATSAEDEPVRGYTEYGWCLERVAPKLHTERITSMMWIGDVLVSGDKFGEISVWRPRCDRKSVLRMATSTASGPCIVARPHQTQIVGLCAGDELTERYVCYSGATGGHICRSDLITGNNETLHSVGDGTRSMGGISSMTSIWKVGGLMVGDERGNVRLIDQRSAKESLKVRFHCGKVSSLDVHSHSGMLLASGGSMDHAVRLWDIRALSEKSYKLLTTCGDNRLRVFEGLPWRVGPPTSTMVHSHTFNRYISIFRAVWDPKDATHRRIIVGRYISKSIGDMALSPIDILDSSTGALLAELSDPSIRLKSPVVAVSPIEDVIASGASRTVCIWCYKKRRKCCVSAFENETSDAFKERARAEGNRRMRRTRKSK